MRLTTLMDVLGCIEGTAGEKIELDSKTISDARSCIDEMIRLNYE